jgi:hypothetical protein
MRRIPAAVLALLLTVGPLATGAVHAADPLPTPAPPSDPLPAGAVMTASGQVLPPPPDGLEETSVHAEMLAAHAADDLHFTPGGAPSITLAPDGQVQMAGRAVVPDGGASVAQLSAAGLPNGLRKEVFGFLPYWMLNDSALSSMNYHLVSTIAYFSVNAKMTGDLAKGTSSSPSTGWAGLNI